MPLLPLVSALLLLTVAGVLRTMAIVRAADEAAERHWDQLAGLHSESGIAFFPTTYARIELERAIAEAAELERTAARRRRTPAWRLTADVGSAV